MKLYDNAYKSSYEEIKTYYPVWYREVKEMDAIWQAEGKQFDDIQAGVIRGINNNFIYWADAETISKWENFLSITYDNTRTLEARRANVAAILVGGGHIGEQEIKAIVRAFTNSDCYVSLETSVERNYVLIIIPRQDANVTFMGDLRAVLGRKIPGHLATTIRLRHQTQGEIIAPCRTKMGRHIHVRPYHAKSYQMGAQVNVAAYAKIGRQIRIEPKGD